MMLIFFQRYHLQQRVIRQLKHLMNMVILLFGKIFIPPKLMIDGTRQMVTTVTYTFQLRHLTQHSTYLQLTFGTQTPFRYRIQVVSYLKFHIVADVFIFLNAAKQFVEIILIRSMQQITHHAKHTAVTTSASRQTAATTFVALEFVPTLT